MIEVEVKAKINDFNSIKKDLYNIGAIESHTEHQEDIYFNSPIKDFAKTDEALRIRKVTIKDSIETFITYKGPKLMIKVKPEKKLK